MGDDRETLSGRIGSHIAIRRGCKWAVWSTYVWSAHQICDCFFSGFHWLSRVSLSEWKWLCFCDTHMQHPKNIPAISSTDRNLCVCLCVSQPLQSQTFSFPPRCARSQLSSSWSWCCLITTLIKTMIQIIFQMSEWSRKTHLGDFLCLCSLPSMSCSVWGSYSKWHYIWIALNIFGLVFLKWSSAFLTFCIICVLSFCAKESNIWIVLVLNIFQKWLYQQNVKKQLCWSSVLTS